MEAVGDFFQVDLPPGFTTPWDHSLQNQLRAAKAALGPLWENAYYSAPIWRFTLAAGLAGPWAVQGVMMPSVDRVGRAYRLTLAVINLPINQTLASHLAGIASFNLLEPFALHCLEDDMSPEALRRGLATLPKLQTPGDLGEEPVLSSACHAAFLMPNGTEAIHPHAEAIWTADFRGQSLIFATGGLPEPPQAILFFDPSRSFLLEKESG